jgi:hypothetical protein
MADSSDVAYFALVVCTPLRPPALPCLRLQVLRRCNWRVLLRDTEELCAALADLGTHPRFFDLCDVVQRCAEERLVPLGTHGPSPAAEAAAQAAAHLDSRCNGGQHKVHSSGGKAGQAGLDGRYWQLAQGGHTCRGRVCRTPLAPRNVQT